MDTVSRFLLSIFAVITSFFSRIPGMPAQSNIALELKECLPKSDQASKETCQRLLNAITTFDDCARAGFPIMESYPERCALPDGRSFTKQTSPSSDGKSANLQGNMVCLPKKDDGTPKTTECLFGLKAENGNHYALDTSILRNDIIVNAKSDDLIEVEGTVVPIEAISSDQWKQYNIKGIIRVIRMNIVE